jgi:hypothetical protein
VDGGARSGDVGGAARIRKEARSAFLKKSAQKTFGNLGHGWLQQHGMKLVKVFCFFFLKKKFFLAYAKPCFSDYLSSFWASKRWVASLRSQ